MEEYPLAEYKVKFLEVGDFQDQHGNYWCNAAFDGIGEPVRWVIKDPSKIKEGESYYGKVTMEKSKAGNAYLRFRREERPEGAPLPDKPGGYVPKDSDAIRAQWAIGRAIEMYNAEKIGKDKLVETAKYLYGLVDTIKGVAAPVDAPEAPQSLKAKWAETQKQAEDTEKVVDLTEGEIMGTEEFDMSQVPF